MTTIDIPALRDIADRLNDSLNDRITDDETYAYFYSILADFRKIIPLPTIQETGWDNSLIGRWAEASIEDGGLTVYNKVLILKRYDGAETVLGMHVDASTMEYDFEELTPLPDFLPVPLQPVHIDETRQEDPKDVSPSKPDHPTVLVTTRDFRAAPEGTIVTCEDLVACRTGAAWYSVGNAHPLKAKDAPEHMAPALVLRWGMGAEAS